MTLNQTHDPALRSFVDSANRAGHDFPIQNLPFGVFRSGDSAPRIGVAIGDAVLDLTAVAERGLLDGLGDVVDRACRADALNDLMALGVEVWKPLRARLSRLLKAGSDRVAADSLIPTHQVTLLLPAQVGNYTDFYASIHHATAIGAMFRPESPLLPNYKWVPIGYHGRASSLVPSQTPIRRPQGQLKDGNAPAPAFGPTQALDYECEVAILMGPGNPIGNPIPVSSAGTHLFGLCLLNDWSARDIQRWEYQPLGPFLSKSFATTLSPWVVTIEALAPFRGPAFARAADDPKPLPYLFDPGDQQAGGFDISLEVWIQTGKMREREDPPVRLSSASFLGMYWTPAQLVAHQTSNGCNLNPGDVLASGTVSGPNDSSRGCLQELTSGGSKPLTLPNGETRRFLENGDEIILRGTCRREGAVPIGFGECLGRIVS
jgi:fumarylacetoacetase